MANRYQIWNKTDEVITPSGDVFTAEQWMQKYPASRKIPYVLYKGPINGGFCSALAQMESVYSQEGCDFSQCKTDEEKLDVIEAFENERKEKAKILENEQREKAKEEALVEERKVAALEFLAVNSLPDVM